MTSDRLFGLSSQDFQAFVAQSIAVIVECVKPAVCIEQNKG